SFTPFEDEEIRGWIQSLRRWQNESKNTKASTLRKAENLIRQGLGMNDPITAQRGSVELLRATSLLHRMLSEQGADIENQGQILYLLGLSYGELPLFFPGELAESFLEQAIRSTPGSNEAKKSYRLLKTIVTRGYTGSGGTHLPPDQRVLLEGLYKLAYEEQK